MTTLSLDAGPGLAPLSYRDPKSSLINIKPLALQTSGTDSSPRFEPGTFGVDRLVLTYPLSTSTHPTALLSYRGVGSRGGKHVPDLGFAVHLRTKLWDGGGPATARVDFNPSRVLEPDSSTLVTATDARDTAKVIMNLLHERGIDPQEGLRDDQVGLQRVDVARDFAVPDPDAWVAAMRGTFSKFGRKQHGYFDNQGRQTSTISGSNGASLRLYAKAGAHPNDAWTEQYSLRFESQLTGQPITRKKGLGSLDRLTDAHLEKVGRLLWQQSRHGQVMISPTPLAVIQATNHQPLFKAAMYGQDQALRQGQKLGLKCNSDVNQALRACGLQTHVRTPKTPMGGRRLDWDRGVALEVLG